MTTTQAIGSELHAIIVEHDRRDREGDTGPDYVDFCKQRKLARRLHTRLALLPPFDEHPRLLTDFSACVYLLERAGDDVNLRRLSIAGRQPAQENTGDSPRHAAGCPGDVEAPGERRRRQTGVTKPRPVFRSGVFACAGCGYVYGTCAYAYARA